MIIGEFFICFSGFGDPGFGFVAVLDGIYWLFC